MSQRLVIFALGLVVIILAGTTVVYYKKYTAVKTNPQIVAQESVTNLEAEVGKLIVLPSGETPTVATVVDAEKLKEQPFFAKAQNGDKVLIYTNARKAILYSPVEKKIVEVAPLNIGPVNAPSAPAAAPITATTDEEKK